VSAVRTKRGWVLRWAIGLAVLSLVLPLLMAALARTAAVREYARQEAEHAIRRELGLSVLISDIDIEPRTLTFVARQIVLDHPQRGRFVEAELLRIRPSWWALLHGRIDLHNITIDHASLWLVVRDGRLVNGPVIKSSGGSGLDVDLPFNKLWLKHSRLIVDGGEYGSGELSDISLFLDSTRRDVLGITLSAPRGVFEHAAEREKLSGLEARARLRSDGVQLELLKLRGSAFELGVRQASLKLPAADEYRGEVELSLALDQLARLHLPIELPHLEGALRARLGLHSGRAGPEGDARISLKRAVLDQYGFGENVELDLKLEHQRLSFEGAAEVVRQGGRVDLSGALELTPSLPLELRVRIVDVEFAKLMEQLGVSPNAIVGWTLAGNMELRGTLAPLDLSGPMRLPTRDFRVTRDAWHELPRRDVIAVSSAILAGTIAVKPEAIVLQHIDIGMRNSRLRVDEVLIGFDNQVRLNGVGEVLDLRDASPLVDFPIAGKGSFEVHVDGTFQDPHAHGHLRFDGFAFASYPFGDLESDFVLERDMQAVRFPELTAKKGRSHYHASGFVIDFNDHRLAIEAALRFDRFAMQDFYHVFHYESDERYTPYQAAVSGTAQLRYSLGFPGDTARGTLRADVDLALEDAELSGFHFASGEAIGTWLWRDHALGYRGGELTIERLSLRKGEGTVNLSGRMGYGGKLDLVVIGDRISLHDTEGFGDRLPDVNGNYAVTGTVRGTPSLPRAELEVIGTGLSYAGEALGDARSYVRLTDKSDPFVAEALTWSPDAPPPDAICPRAREGLARGSWPADPPLNTLDGPVPALDAPMAFLICGSALSGQLAFDVAVGRTSAFPLRGEIELERFPLAKFLPKQAAAMQGVLSGQLRLRGGALLTPAALSGEVTLTSIKLGQAGVALENEGAVRARFMDGAFEIEQAAFMGPGSELRIAGGGSLTGGLGLSVSGDVDLGILPTFSSELREASGSAQFALKVSGRLDKPSVFGQARVDGASLQLASLPFPIESIDGTATFSAERVVIERVTAKVMSGTLAVQGVAALEGRRLGSYRLELDADRLALNPRDGVELVLGAQTQLSWKQGDRLPKLQGLVRLGRVNYTRSIAVGRTLNDMAKKTRADVDTYDPQLDHLAFDLRVVQSEPIRIDNNLIEAEIAIDDGKEPFRLLGTDQRFGVLGSMDIRQGTVRVRDRPFLIKDGEIAFDNASRVDPHFDMHAETDVRRNVGLGQLHWHIGVHAWGAPDSFQFALTSDPYLSQDDIALLLAVGMTYAEMQSSSVTSTAAFEALAAVTGVEREVKRALPAIDDVHIASAYSLRSQRTEPQLHLGKRIAERVRLNASTGLSQSRDFSTGVEYQVGDKTSVGATYNNVTSTSASQLGDVGVDLKWRLEFD
jgi:translocation and assembly module TamB